jgi:hypothetical protein
VICCGGGVFVENECGSTLQIGILFQLYSGEKQIGYQSTFPIVSTSTISISLPSLPCNRFGDSSDATIAYVMCPGDDELTNCKPEHY